MKQLTIGDLLKAIEEIKTNAKLSDEQIKNMPIYLGDDEELNGVHDAMFCNYVSEEDADIVELIEENRTNSEFKDGALLIS